jgi:peptidoglycan/xylan/chitin deacetylase (PgdA/CDA1 family)
VTVPPMAPTARLSLRKLPMILMYHAVADATVDPNQLCVPPQRFASQMAWLAAHGLRGVGTATLVEAMRIGTQRGLVGITFDDGYASVLEHALPVLQRHGFGATAFVIAGRIGGRNDWDEGTPWPLLTADRIRALAAAGLEIGSHSVTHVSLVGLAPGQLAAEVARSRSELAALVGREIAGFAYPYGSMDAMARQAVQDAGYSYACAVDTPPDALSLMGLPRIYIGPHDTDLHMTVKRYLFRSYIAYKGRRR